MSCLVSCPVDLYNSLICAHKKEYYELHGNNNSYNSCGVVSWGSCLVHEVVVSRGNDLFLSLLSLLHIIKNPMWHCIGPMRLLTCTNVLAPFVHSWFSCYFYARKIARWEFGATARKGPQFVHKREKMSQRKEFQKKFHVLGNAVWCSFGKKSFGKV
jgi:hypothetical protein